MGRGRWRVMCHMGRGLFAPHQCTKPSSSELGFGMGRLAVSYFHTGIRTIIGAEAFHGPVRNGKAWDHLAMATRHKLSQIKEADAESVTQPVEDFVFCIAFPLALCSL